MSTTITLQEAQARLPELIARLGPGDQVVIVLNNQPVAELRPSAVVRPKPQFGACQGMLIVNAEDEDHLQDFQEYMP